MSRIQGELGQLREALVVGGHVERAAALPEPPSGPERPVALAYVAPVAATPTVEAPASRPARPPATPPPPEPSWIEKRSAQLEAEGVHPNVAREQAREEGRLAARPRSRWSEVEQARRERYEHLCRGAGVAHCEEMSCFQASYGMCKCPCEGCVQATGFLEQASRESEGGP
jgi:hypothetical protein